MRSPFSVWWAMDGNVGVRFFQTERDARTFINERADGHGLFMLYDESGDELIVASSWPVLMVA